MAVGRIVVLKWMMIFVDVWRELCENAASHQNHVRHLICESFDDEYLNFDHLNLYSHLRSVPLHFLHLHLHSSHLHFHSSRSQHYSL